MHLTELAEIYVPENKVRLYLLSETHSLGKHKAVFFNRFGFTIEAWEILVTALREHAFTHEIAGSQSHRDGTTYLIEGSVQSPDGRNPIIRSVWIVHENSPIARLVTAYPI